MCILFIADVHLSIQEPAITKSFIHFLHHRALHAKSLYILGDLFDRWIGDDDTNPLHKEISSSIKILSQDYGVSCYFLPGNRDFLLGHHYAKTCGMILLPKELILEIEGYRIVLLHGDSLCIEDTKYQNFRKTVDKYWLKNIFLLLPLSIRIFISNILRKKSIFYNLKKK